jgi:hypothetical protein
MASSRFIVRDGIIEWYEGPEWDKVVEDSFKEAAPGLEATAQANAPWEDQTGEAREGLHTTVGNADGTVTLALAHGVDYGFWLEVIQNGKFAIILPTLEQQSPAIIAEATKNVRDARKGRNF